MGSVYEMGEKRNKIFPLFNFQEGEKFEMSAGNKTVGSM
jgi:hypothetical protein